MGRVRKIITSPLVEIMMSMLLSAPIERTEKKKKNIYIYIYIYYII